MPATGWTLTLAQAAQNLLAVLPWLGVLIVFVIAAGFVILFLRKRLLAPGETRESAGSIFEELEAMHARGNLSDEELAEAKKSVVRRLAGRGDPGAPGPSEKGSTTESARD